jgi:transposase InsO family protein
MKDEYSDRHQAIQMRLAGQAVEAICRTLGRSRDWFHKWWSRYLAYGPDGLYDLSRASYQIARRISPALERTILTIRRRLEAHAQPSTRYSLIGATAIIAELKALHVQPLPSARTVERVLQRNGATLPKVRLSRLLPRSTYPTPQAQQSNQLHQVDLVGPIYLKGQRRRWYIYVCKDIYDGAVCLKLGRSRKMDEVLTFLGDSWKTLGRPAQVQFDNAREMAGWGRAARYLSRVIRLCLRFGIEAIFIPPAQPQRNGSIENFNGWFQNLLLQRYFSRPGDLRRELQRLQDAVNTQHVQARLGGLTPMQYRRRQRLQKLPQRFRIPIAQLPIAAGRVTFIRQVSVKGQIHLLSLTFKLGKRLKGQYVKVVVDTLHNWLTVYLNGRVFKRWPFKLLNK